MLYGLVFAGITGTDRPGFEFRLCDHCGDEFRGSCNDRGVEIDLSGHAPRPVTAMRIGLTSIFVDDQDKAEKFNTEVLGLEVKTNAPYGPAAF
jgi:hypothetical protein